MRKILIVGAGQAGLQLALGLLNAGQYEVTVMSLRTPEEILTGHVTSTQCMFATALAMEHQAVGADLWKPEKTGHRIGGLGVSVPGGPGPGPAVDWLGRLTGYAQSIDQRLKMSTLLDLVTKSGGNVVITPVTNSDLDRLAGLYDLVIVAAGKGDVVQLFDRDPDRSEFTTPMRSLAVSYVHGVTPRPEHPEVSAVRLDLIPGLGELIMIPALTAQGPCDILFWEGVPKGPIDSFDEIATDPQAVLDHTLDLIRQYAPWEFDRCIQAELTDAGGTLIGRYTPVVRRPVATLPSGRSVLGMGDVVVALDPITGQGSNNAARAADAYLQAIIDHGERPFDETFMHAAFEAYWQRVAVCAGWTNAMLKPPPEHVMAILGAAGQHQQVADRFANAFSDPDDLARWFTVPDLAREYLAAAAADNHAK